VSNRLSQLNGLDVVLNNIGTVFMTASQLAGSDKEFIHLSVGIA
jgi:hypothetical protein